MAAADVVSTAEAERRVLVLENPGLPGGHVATDSLYAGIQLIMPGEFARTHRHTAAALRFVIEGRGTYTAVAGEKAYMEPGDFIVTPSWAWHEHRNESDAPTIWLDVLDVPLVRFLGAGFSEHYAEAEFLAKAPPADSLHRSGSLPPARLRIVVVHAAAVQLSVRAGARDARASKNDGPLGPLPRDQDAVRRPDQRRPRHPDHFDVLATRSEGFTTEPHIATSSAIVAVVAGTGVAAIGSGAAAKELRYGPRDLFAVPGWHALTLRADEESVLFSASDEAAQRKLGIWRERRGRLE